MKYFGFYTLSGAWLFALLIPLVVFYFLKLKRPRQQIPSLVLWRQVLSDQRVNSPFQRFKKNLLLLLQVLLLALMATAAMQPYWRGRAARTQRLPILIDCSASMGALDKAGGMSRLDAAKEHAGRLIHGLLPDQEICLIQFSRTARKAIGFTDNKLVLRAALKAIKVEETPSNLDDALRMAQALVRTEPFSDVLLLSDGNVPMESAFELSFNLKYQQAPPAGPNLGITSLNAKRSDDGNWDVFVAVEGSSSAGGSATVELSCNGEPLRSETIRLDANRAERILFRVPGDKPSALQATLTPDAFDSLACDNVARLDVPAIRPLWVFCPPSLVAYRHALTPLRGIRLLPQGAEGRAEPFYDLVVTDRVEDLALPTRMLFTVGILPGDLQKLCAINPSENDAVVDWQRTAALLQHVELADLLIRGQAQSVEGIGEGAFENLGYDVLVHGRKGPLLVQKNEPEKTDCHLLFHSDQSTLPYRIGFPIMVWNAVNMAFQAAGLSEAPAGRTGVLAGMKVSPGERVTVRAPDDTRREETCDKLGWMPGILANSVGTYRIYDGLSEVGRLHANLLSSVETSLKSVEQIHFNEGLTVKAAAAVQSDRSLWRSLALAGFGLLLVEWWYFQRRTGGAPR